MFRTFYTVFSPCVARTHTQLYIYTLYIRYICVYTAITYQRFSKRSFRVLHLRLRWLTVSRVTPFQADGAKEKEEAMFLMEDFEPARNLGL